MTFCLNTDVDRVLESKMSGLEAMTWVQAVELREFKSLKLLSNQYRNCELENAKRSRAYFIAKGETVLKVLL